MGSDRNLAVYTVHEEPNPAADRLDRAERLAFLRDGFSWPAALWTPLWLASRQLWLPLAVYAAVVGALVGGVKLLGPGANGAGLIGFAVAAVHLIAGYEAYLLERWSYESRGFTLVGTVAGRNKIECERRFFETWLPRQPVIQAPQKSTNGGPGAGTLAASASPSPGAPAGPVRAAPWWKPFHGRTA
jgi:hypothetical protein